MFLPVGGVCGSGFSGTLGGFNATFRSLFCPMYLLSALGEELEELPELVTVSPELHGTEMLQLRICDVLFLMNEDTLVVPALWTLDQKVTCCGETKK